MLPHPEVKTKDGSGNTASLPPLPTFILESFFLARSPVAAIVAKYWMTLLVFTVFPAPDSPLLGVIKEGAKRCHAEAQITALPNQ